MMEKSFMKWAPDFISKMADDISQNILEQSVKHQMHHKQTTSFVMYNHMW